VQKNRLALVTVLCSQLDFSRNPINFLKKRKQTFGITLISRHILSFELSEEYFSTVRHELSDDVDGLNFGDDSIEAHESVVL